MQLDVNLCEQATADNLPDQAEDEMLGAIGDIRRADVHDRATDGLGRSNDDVVVLGNLKRVQSLA